MVKGITLFIDRSIGGIKTVAPRLASEEGISVILHDQLFGSNTKDDEWLEKTGREGWWVLSRDQRIRYRKLELNAVQHFGVGMFVLVSPDMTGPQMAEAFLAALPRIRRFTEKYSRPFIAKVYKDGKVRYWWPDLGSQG